MPARSSEPSEPFFVSTPQGVFTVSGQWFQTTEAQLRAYAGSVLDHVSVETLLRRADRWLGSPRAVALWMLPVLLMVLGSAWAAAALTLSLYVLWSVVAPSWVTRYGARVVAWLDHPVVQGGYYVFALSLLAAQGQLGAVGVGLGAFILFRWGLVQRALRPAAHALQRRLYALPVPDQVLRAFVIRAALEHGVDVAQVDRMRRRMNERRSS